MVNCILSPKIMLVSSYYGAFRSQLLEYNVIFPASCVCFMGPSMAVHVLILAGGLGTRLEVVWLFWTAPIVNL